jgi:putative nucleotidyltransferase with HDIG domain
VKEESTELIPSTTHDAVCDAIGRYEQMPAMYGKLIASLSNPEIGFDQIAEIVKYDPGVTMNILRVVNSAAFGGGQHVDSLQHATIRLGAKRLLHLIMVKGVSARMSVPVPGYGLAPAMLLRHSVGVALASELMAKTLRRKQHDLLFTAGLLHDMGKILLGPFVEEHMAAFEEGLKEDDVTFDLLEDRILGITHTEAGALLMEHWGFPSDLVDAVRFHHNPVYAGQNEEFASIVHLSDVLVYGMGVGEGVDGLMYRVRPEAVSVLGICTNDLEKIAGTVLGQMRDWDTAASI